MKQVFVPLALAAVVFTGCNTQSPSNKGEGGKVLTLKAPKTVEVAQDDSAKVEIAVERTKFDDAVSIKFDKLPEGVVVAEDNTKIDKGVKERTFTLKATDKAKPGKHTIHVVASSAGMTDKHDVVVEVKEKGTQSVSGSSPAAKADAELKRKRDELSATVQQQMKEIDATMVKLREQAKTADAKVKADLNKSIDDLHTRRQELSKEYGRIQSTTAEAWEDFSGRLTSAANELAAGASKAWERFKQPK